MPRQPNRKQSNRPGNPTPKKSSKPVRAPARRATQEVHFMRMLKEGKHIQELRDAARDKRGEDFRSYLLHEFAGEKGAEPFRTMSLHELEAYRAMLVERANDMLRTIGKRMI